MTVDYDNSAPWLSVNQRHLPRKRRLTQSATKKNPHHLIKTPRHNLFTRNEPTEP